MEDNAGALELANVPKMRPSHINITYHHFRQFIQKGKIKVLLVKSEDQLADILTKPLAADSFVKFCRERSMGGRPMLG